MKNTLFFSIILLSLFSQGQSNCTEGNFENEILTDYNFYASNFTNNSPYFFGFGSDILDDPFFYQINQASITLNSTQLISLVDQSNIPLLAFNGASMSQVSTGNRAIRLNVPNFLSYNSAAITKDINITYPYITLDFAALFSNNFIDGPHTDDFMPYVLIEVYDNDINSSIYHKIISSPMNTINLQTTPNGLWEYLPWSCLNIDVSQSIGHNVTLRAYVSDCAINGEHDAILYLDEICYSNQPCSQTIFGSLYLDPINLNCPEGLFTISGSLNPPSNSNGFPPSLSLYTIDSNGNTTQVDSSFIVGNTFNFNLDVLSTFGNNPSGSYEFYAVATYYSSTFEQIQVESLINSATIISFNNCTNSCETVTGSFINGSILCWNDITDGDYVIQFISSNDCPYTGLSTQTSMNYTQNSNCIDLLDVLDDLGKKCFRWRIRTDCNDWNWTDWCLLGVYTSHPFVSFRDCIPTAGRQAIIKDLKVYPNPATNKLTLITKEAKLNSLELYNIYGKLINRKEKINSNEYTIDVSRLTRGYYVLKIQLEDKSIIYRNIILK